VFPSWAEGNPSQPEGNPNQPEGNPSPAEGNPSLISSINPAFSMGYRRIRQASWEIARDSFSRSSPGKLDSIDLLK
jgi:hypothetical protein